MSGGELMSGVIPDHLKNITIAKNKKEPINFWVIIAMTICLITICSVYLIMPIRVSKIIDRTGLENATLDYCRWISEHDMPQWLFKSPTDIHIDFNECVPGFCRCEVTFR